MVIIFGFFSESLFVVLNPLLFELCFVLKKCHSLYVVGLIDLILKDLILDHVLLDLVVLL